MEVNAEQNQRYQLLQQRCLDQDPEQTKKIPTQTFRDIIEDIGGVTNEEIDEMMRLSDEEDGEVDYVASIPKLAGYY